MFVELNKCGGIQIPYENSLREMFGCRHLNCSDNGKEPLSPQKELFQELLHME
jgi:hypothetical protein